ncbi:NirF protein [bacterium]|nr:NirF protein [bacterium]
MAIIQDGKVTAEVSDLGDLSHATVKFHRGAAYVVSRDGWLSRIDAASRTPSARARVGQSSIGLTFLDNYVAVANYEPREVVILDLLLREVKRIPTGSRVVGIKAWGDRLAVALMDKDELWVLNARQDFGLEKSIVQAGAMPFDALLWQEQYVVGFYKEPVVGVLDLKSLAYHRVELKSEEGLPILKIPHFGQWGVEAQRAYLPIPGSPTLAQLDLRTLACQHRVELPGLPVFATLSPDGRLLAVNYSGPQENLVTLLDPETLKILQNVEVGERVMHLRFSPDSKRLYASCYFENQVKSLSGVPWKVEGMVPVPGPSGVFLVPQEEKP